MKDIGTLPRHRIGQSSFSSLYQPSTTSYNQRKRRYFSSGAGLLVYILSRNLSNLIEPRHSVRSLVSLLLFPPQYLLNVFRFLMTASTTWDAHNKSRSEWWVEFPTVEMAIKARYEL